MNKLDFTDLEYLLTDAKDVIDWIVDIYASYRGDNKYKLKENYVQELYDYFNECVLINSDIKKVWCDNLYAHEDIHIVFNEWCVTDLVIRIDTAGITPDSRENTIFKHIFNGYITGVYTFFQNNFEYIDIPSGRKLYMMNRTEAEKFIDKMYDDAKYCLTTTDFDIFYNDWNAEYSYRMFIYYKNVLENYENFKLSSEFGKRIYTQDFYIFTNECYKQRYLDNYKEDLMKRWENSRKKYIESMNTEDAWCKNVA